MTHIVVALCESGHERRMPVSPARDDVERLRAMFESLFEERGGCNGYLDEVRCGASVRCCIEELQ